MNINSYSTERYYHINGKKNIIAKTIQLCKNNKKVYVNLKITLTKKKKDN